MKIWDSTVHIGTHINVKLVIFKNKYNGCMQAGTVQSIDLANIIWRYVSQGIYFGDLLEFFLSGVLSIPKWCNIL